MILALYFHLHPRREGAKFLDFGLEDRGVTLVALEEMELEVRTKKPFRQSRYISVCFQEIENVIVYF